MAENDLFERGLADAFLRLGDDVPGTVDAAAVAHRVALEHPRRRVRALAWGLVALPRLAWILLLLAALLAAMVGTMLVAGSQPEPKLAPMTPSPTANPAEALAADLAAVWSNPYDAAKVAALYAPDAVFHDLVSNETSTGLEAIQARIKEYAAQPFKVENTSAPIRQDNFVAVFFRFGTGENLYPGLGVYEVKDGKVLNQWVYPAP